MDFKQRQLIATLAAVCWIFAQNISLDHQFTSEHLSQTDSHICLSFANDNDDLALSSSAMTELTKLKSHLVVSPPIPQVSSISPSFRARAPPTQLL